MHLNTGSGWVHSGVNSLPDATSPRVRNEMSALGLPVIVAASMSAMCSWHLIAAKSHSTLAIASRVPTVIIPAGSSERLSEVPAMR